jgi:hypothetical protein
LQTVQGAGKIILLIRNLRTPGEPHELLLIVLDRFQYTAGVGFNVMENTKMALPHLEGVWLPTARDYLGLKIQPLERHGDRYIMDIVLSLQGFLAKEIKLVNYCRLYLQVLTLSDICNAEGNKLAEGILQGYKCTKQSYSLLEEPYQERPNEMSWGVWRRWLKQVCYDKDQLIRPLGPWFACQSTRQGWPCYYGPVCDVIHIVLPDGKVSSHRRLRFRVFSKESFDASN